jgi:mono/diheme cytochrome c family protein
VKALAQADKVLAIVSWLAAAAVVLMLLVGPKLVAEDKAQSEPGAAAYAGAATGAAASGKQVFTTNCGSCHTLSAAGTSGQIGPDLDGTTLTAAQVAAKVREGGGGMPAFAGKLSAAEIDAVAAFVTGSR